MNKFNKLKQRLYDDDYLAEWASNESTPSLVNYLMRDYPASKARFIAEDCLTKEQREELESIIRDAGEGWEQYLTDEG